MKKAVFILAFLFCAVLLLSWSTGPAAAAAPKDGYPFIGNSATKIYHGATCASAGKISAANAVYFKSKKDAVKAGYAPCKTCKPDQAKKADAGCNACTNARGGSDCKNCK